MTEEEWDACNSPDKMWEWLDSHCAVSTRKRWLWALACCQRVTHLLSDERGQVALQLGGLAIEGGADACSAKAAGRAAFDASLDVAKELASESLSVMRAASAAYRAVALVADHDDALKGQHQWAARCAAKAVCISDPRVEETMQCRILRDVVGNPFDPVPRLMPGKCPPVLVTLARDIYREGSFERLAELGQALEAAGLGQTRLVDHCKSGSQHVRGCFALDAVLNND